MPEIHLEDFFTYYKGTVEQKEAVQLLQSTMPDSLLKNSSAWVVKYREQPPAPSWPITKEQMLYIMQADSALATADLMNDYAECVATFEMDTLAQVYFLGQCGHESGGLKWSVELSDGEYLEGRTDIGNVNPGDGPLYKGASFLQLTGRANYQSFSDWLDKIGKPDPDVMKLGAEYVGAHYPWTASGFWWLNNRMNAFCAARKECSNAEIDQVGAKVNGRLRPNGADDRIAYTDRAYRTLIGV